MSSIRKQVGFTLVELMVSMAIAGIVMATIYSSYASQQRAYVTQEQVAGMQQNLRAAMFHLERDIRMAGYDPTGKAGAGIVLTPDFRLTKDENRNGAIGTDANEDIIFRLEDASHPGRKNLVRRIQTASGQQSHILAESIDAVNFVCLDENGAVTTTPGAIRSVQISVVARTSRIDQGYTGTTIYRNLQNGIVYPPGGVYPSGDAARYRRNMLRGEVRCRNLGMS